MHHDGDLTLREILSIARKDLFLQHTPFWYGRCTVVERDCNAQDQQPAQPLTTRVPIRGKLA